MEHGVQGFRFSSFEFRGGRFLDEEEVLSNLKFGAVEYLPGLSSACMFGSSLCSLICSALPNCQALKL